MLALIGGIIAAVRLLRTEPNRDPVLEDLELQIEDLERRREELYHRLRGSESVELAERDRAELERHAAITLRELDLLQQDASKRRGEAQPASERPSVDPGFFGRHPLLAGFALGASMVALLGILIFQAGKAAQPADTMGPDGQPMPPVNSNAAAGGGADSGAPPAGAAQPPLPPAVEAEVERLRGTLTGDGATDAPTHGAIADLMLAAQRPIDAFQEAQRALELEPDEPKGLYVSGVVRYMMGQPNEAFGLIERAIEVDPQNAQTGLILGVLRLQTGDREGAVDAWEDTLARGVTDDRIENLLELARQGATDQEILSGGA